MSGTGIVFIEQFRQPEGLLQRARRRRQEALGRRIACVVQTSQGGDGIVEHVFSGVPRLVDLIARSGPEAVIVGVRMEPMVERRREGAATVAS